MSIANDLQRAIWEALVADIDLNASIAGRIFDFVPQGASLPYVSFGPMDLVSDNATCSRGYEIYMQIDVWSGHRGYKECKAVTGLVEKALASIDLQPSENRLVRFDHRSTRFMRDPDGLTSHGIVTFIAFVEQGARA